VIRGEELPACRTCKGAVHYQLIRQTDHIHHDWDLAGPLAASPEEKIAQFDSVRAFPRFNIDIPIAVSETREIKGAIALQGHTKDLSEAGMAAVIGERLSGPKRTFSIQIPAPHGTRQISVHARLRYRNGMRHGFEFTRISPSDREALRKICERD
jgi:hypothetical protein